MTEPEKNTHRVRFVPMDLKDRTFGPYDCVLPLNVYMRDGRSILGTAHGCIHFTGLPNASYLLHIEAID